MKEYQSLSHTRWDYKYHVVFYTEAKEEADFRGAASTVGGVFHELAAHKESKIVEGHLMGDQ